MSSYDDIIGNVFQNPHFIAIHDILSAEKIPEDTFMTDFKELFFLFLEEHVNDNEALKEESYYYILPGIAIYKTLQRFSKTPLESFKKMWFHGAEKGAAYLQEKARDEEFLAGWCRNITPKQTDRGAFIFDIKSVSDSYTEYHVLKCPYVLFCREYECQEITTVFCDSDDISFGNIHPRLIWGRTQTIGRGEQFCDFRYTYIKAERSADAAK